MRLIKYLKGLQDQYPNIWSQVERLRQGKGKDLPDWPDWCYLPMAGAYAVAPQGSDLILPDNVAIVAALATWRPTQGIYQLDKDILEEVWHTPLSGNLPRDLLFRLPEWCCYLETPGRHFMSIPLVGFFVHLEYDVNTHEIELRLLLDFDQEQPLLGIPIHLDECALEQSLSKTWEQSIEVADEKGLPRPDNPHIDPSEVAPLVSLALYLCSVNSDIQNEDGQSPSKPKPVKTKRGWRLFVPSRQTHWQVGYRIGAALRSVRRQVKESQGGTHAGPVPHVRRAHWHSFWIGPKNDPVQRKLVVKWLPHIPVGFKWEDVEDLIPTVRQVDKPD